MISYIEALELLKQEFKLVQAETEIVKLDDASNRTLAEDVFADVNLPPFDNSAVDGIAIIYNEHINQWEIIGEISAGNYTKFNLSDGSAVSIMTGSRLPDDCNVVIPIEDIIVDGEIVRLKDGALIRAGMNIRQLGTDIKQDELAVAKNTIIKSRHLASLASCGKKEVKVFKRLNMSVLSTGDELIQVDEKPASDKIRISNTYSLCGSINELGQNANNLCFIGDNRAALKSILKDELESDADILITTGGVSVGKFDYVKDLFKELGVSEIFWRVFIKPGKPIWVGVYVKGFKRKLVFGLPGNPVSCLVNFEVFIKPFIAEMYGLNSIKTIYAILQNDLRKKDKKRHFMKAIITQIVDGTFYASSEFSQSSGNLVEFSKANCLIEIEEERMNPRKGEMVKCILM